VPGLLLLVARDLALYDPPRVLAWRLTHDQALASAVAWLGPLLPAPSGALDRDPVALLLAGLAALLALAYASLAAAGARPEARALVIAIAATVLVVLPSAAFVGLGAAADRPPAGRRVVQLPRDRQDPLREPHGADYSHGSRPPGPDARRRARGQPDPASPRYLPGTHLVMLPFHLSSRAALGSFDPQIVTLLFYVLVVVLAARLPASAEACLAATNVAALNPLVY
jgi:hypothetical protein